MSQETLTLQDGTIVQVADFGFGFTLDTEGKAAKVEEADDGTLYIEGYASDFELDRQDEAFEPNAFQEGLNAYKKNPVMLYHHKKDVALGDFSELQLHEGKGLWVRGRVPKPPENSPISHYYDQIKNGVLRGFSVGGRFYRRMTETGPKIFKCDLHEISVTPQPVNPRMLFAVAGKAFQDMPDPVTTTNENEEEMDPELQKTLKRLDALSNTFDGLLGGKAAPTGAGGHPDGPAISALQYHLRKIHQLATDTVQSSDEPKVQETAQQIAKDTKKHISSVADLEKKFGPLPNIYGGTTI